MGVSDQRPCPSCGRAIGDGVHTSACAVALMDERDELRAVVAPLLDSPFETNAQGDRFCALCRKYRDDPPVGEDHEPTCPVLRRDDLLGRGAH